MNELQNVIILATFILLYYKSNNLEPVLIEIHDN